ncbi:MAG: aminotransferase class V-fold PLP-dependent enzyme [Clostridia bacterium]|nr:aminotransferase class V-fold PLP-dependent enzyme [Clostridia bacterium]
MIYFDNAATTGVKPPSVIQAVKLSLEKLSANPGRSGHYVSVKAAEAVYKVREKIAYFFNSSGPQNVVFTLNCTHSINCVLKGVLNKGEHVVVSSLEHNAVIRPLTKLGCSYSVADVSDTNDDITLENFKKSIKPNTKLVFCTGASNVTGKILPIEKIGKLCREKGVLFGVDAAQTAGVLPIDMKKMNIDFLCIAPHKGLYAPMGIGILICEKNIPNTIIEGGTGTNSLQAVQPLELPERLESGTLNLPAVLGVGAGIDFVKKTTISKLYKHEMELIQNIYNGLRKNQNILLYTPYPDLYDFVPVLSFNFKEKSSDEIADYLNENDIAVRAGYHCAPSAHRQLGTLDIGTVRVAVSGFNNKNEVSKFLSVINAKKT